ncbi:hypothetical protein QFZ65_003352 [Arthrobacter sp. B3I9]|uniref:hypothetical protein n=1 Tax=Arthrobacter sp. B3I9 TaxID=3042270 RepID=UPI002791120F|nr:hypothetical protein [Arthrobacter sp. B3I9]MDQ0851414.1 hypothetical protein [Arthrobacter sp. B3I9]
MHRLDVGVLQFDGGAGTAGIDTTRIVATGVVSGSRHRGAVRFVVGNQRRNGDDAVVGLEDLHDVGRRAVVRLSLPLDRQGPRGGDASRGGVRRCGQ